MCTGMKTSSEPEVATKNDPFLKCRDCGWQGYSKYQGVIKGKVVCICGNDKCESTNVEDIITKFAHRIKNSRRRL